MKNKNYTIEIYRFIFTMCVVMGHLAASTVLDSKVFEKGGYSVDFFFILSGLLLYNSFRKSWSREDSILGYTVNFLRKRITRFAPIYYICFIAGAVYHIWLYSVYTDKSALDILNYEKDLWPELIFLNGIFFKQDSANSATWYISSLLVGTLVILLFLTVSDKLDIGNEIILLMLFCSCFYLFYWGGLRPAFWRTVRAICGLSLGGICNLIILRMQKLKIDGCCKALLSFLEWFCIAGVIYFMFYYQGMGPEVGIFLTISFAGLIIFAFLQKTWIAVMLNRRIFKTPGMLSYAIYVSHLLVLIKFGWFPGFDLLEDRAYSYMIIIFSVILWGVFMNYLPSIMKYVFTYSYGLVHAKNTIRYIRYRERD